MIFSAVRICERINHPPKYTFQFDGTLYFLKLINRHTSLFLFSLIKTVENVNHQKTSNERLITLRLRLASWFCKDTSFIQTGKSRKHKCQSHKKYIYESFASSLLA